MFMFDGSCMKKDDLKKKIFNTKNANIKKKCQHQETFPSEMSPLATCFSACQHSASKGRDGPESALMLILLDVTMQEWLYIYIYINI